MKIKLEQFSGPLDLLLSLLEERKMAISEISLSDITEQYLLYLDKLEADKAEKLSDFLVIGAKLLLLKSRILLPQFAREEEEGSNLSNLEEQLRLYKSFVDASVKLNKMWLSGYESAFRTEPARKPLRFIPPNNLARDLLRDSMAALLNRIKPPKPLPEQNIDKSVLMKERIDKIRYFLNKSGRLFFHEIMDNARNKTEIIVSFLALLELVKQKAVLLKQDNFFGDILIRRT